MKNKNVVCGIILVMIVLLSVITLRYYKYKLDVLYSKEQSEKKEEDNKNAGADKLIKDGYLSGDVGVKYPTTYKEISSLTKRNAYAFYVIGRTGCPHCEKYKPVLEKVAKNKKIEIVYIDVVKLSSEDYESFVNSNLTILGKCNNSKKDIMLSDGFTTPMGLFISKNKTYDCLRGFISETNLINYMKKIGYIQ